ncbi:MAG: helix-turn-helix domain-containing protein [Anaerolineaceae bacterium]|nr:helix-turn-helix domain-containing protein [Anaerolineaceae bacterium]
MNTKNRALWTPIYDEIVQKHGIITAAVFGIIWRYSQMRDQVCRASINSLADKLGVNRLTVIRHINLLLAEGLIQDRSPRYRNRPHVYVVTPLGSNLISGGINRADSAVEDIDDEEQESDDFSEPDPSISSDNAENSISSEATLSNLSNPSGVTECDSAISCSNRGSILDQLLAVTESDLNQTPLRDSFKERKKKPDAATALWRTIRHQLEPDISQGRFSLYVYPTEAVSWENATLTLAVRDEEDQIWFNQVLKAPILKWLLLLTNAPAQLNIILQSDL